MIIGYIHICQKGEWKRSLSMILDAILYSGLYEVIQEIRCCIVNDMSILIPDEILNYPKLNIVYVGYSHEYERPTLLHMRNSVIKDKNDTQYFYCHTKGLRWFGTLQEPFIIDWIKLLLYWNIEKWKYAVVKLKDHDTYGCNYYIQDNINPSHYSGNFFWTTHTYLSSLPQTIGPNYNDPEFWLCLKNPNYFNAFSSGLEGMGHYTKLYPENCYKF